MIMILEDVDLEDVDDDLIIGKKKNKISLVDMDYLSWKEYLQKDAENIRSDDYYAQRHHS
jgi:hypothetical protein